MTNLDFDKIKQSAVLAQVNLNDAMWSADDAPENIFDISSVLTESVEALSAAISTIPDVDTALQGATSAGQMVLLNNSAQKNGHWQLTTFDAAGLPWGDTQYPTKKLAVAEFLSIIELQTLSDFEGRFPIAPAIAPSSQPADIVTKRKRRP